MTYLLPTYFQNLGLDQTATERDVKRAYAAKLRTIDQATQAAEFQQLRQDYEATLNHIKNGWGFVQIDTPDDPERVEPMQLSPDQEAEESSVSVNTNLETSEAIREDTPEKTPAQALQEFAEHLQEYAPSDLPSIKTLLTKTLASPDLIGLQARQDFEQALMRELAKREHSDETLFGMHSLGVLLAAKEQYDWEQSTTPMAGFYQNGFGYVQSLLDQLAMFKPEKVAFWVSLTDTPTPRGAKQLKIPLPDNYGGGTPQIRNFAFGSGHLEQWRKALAAAHPISSFIQRVNAHPLFPSTLFSYLKQWRVLAVIAFALFIVVQCTINEMGSKQKNAQALVKTTVACDATYGRLIGNNWNQVISSDLSAVWQCMQTTQPPQMCQDRAAAAALFERQTQITKTDSSSTIEYWKYNIGSVDWVFNSTESPSYSFTSSASCSARWTAAANTAWLGVPDLPAAKNMVTLLYYCKDSIPHQSQSFAALIKRTDVWMELALVKNTEARIALKDLVRAAPTPTAELIQQDHWQACQHTITAPQVFREHELAAVRARAQAKP
jgi:hypothetical protein